MAASNKQTNKKKKATVVSRALFDELCELFQDTKEDAEQMEKELAEFREFLHWKNLEDEYRYFQLNSYEVSSPDLPFPWRECPPYPGAEAESMDSTLGAEHPGSH